MMPTITEFTPELMSFLRESMEFNPETGALIWRARPLHHFKDSWRMNQWNSLHSGTPVGTVGKTTKGFVQSHAIYIRYRGKKIVLRTHRVIYSLAVRPILPSEEIDHKDRNPLNNRLDNLRIVTRSQNLHNVLQKRRAGTKLGLPKGVMKTGNKFAAMIMVDKKRRYLGIFPTPEEAHEAYRKASIEAMGEFSAYA